MKQFLKLGRTQSSDRSAREPEGSAVRADYKIGYVINPMLLLFEELSGLKVNFHKSMLTGVNILASWLSEAAVLMNCRRGIIPFVYLGLPIGGDSRKLSFLKPVIDRIVSRLSSWNHKFLSFGGRLVLLKSVLSSLPVYFLSFFKAPTAIISSIESIFKIKIGGAVRILGKLLGLTGSRFVLQRRKGVGG